MKLLLWVAPWAAHGDIHFYKNAVQKHLIPQGNILKNEGWDIDLFLPEGLDIIRSAADKKINIIDFSIEDQLACFGSLRDLSCDFYQNENSSLVHDVSIKLKEHLADSYDIILLWETPVPFLETLYPEALVVHQMPGVYSRAPYPHTVTFDPWGLYKKSSLTINSNEIMSGVTHKEEDLFASEFLRRSQISIEEIQPFSRKDLDYKNQYSKLLLVPLQVSAHYAFQSDTTFSNQMDFLLDVLKDVDSDTGVVVTQYVTPRVSDTILNNDTLSALQRKWPNIIFNPLFDKINGISQFLLPLVDNVATCSSSIGMQAVALSRNVHTYGNTYISPYSQKNIEQSKVNNSSYRNKVLSYMLNKNQPLASSVTKDGKFLSKLLMEMYSLKSVGNLTPENLPSFSKIDSDYNSKFFEQVVSDRAANQLISLKLPISTKTHTIKNFRRFVNDNNVKVISFDVFDTLVDRPTEVPIDLFKLLNNRVLEITCGVVDDFAKARQGAEVEVRNSKNGEEITYDEIYDRLQQVYNLEESIVEEIKSLEVDAELALIKPRLLGKKLWDIAVQTQKPIIIISDMYLSSDVVERILINCGYHGYTKIYVSSEYCQSKKNGKLFDLILEDLNIPGDAMLHIGDNRIADNEMPKERGIRAYRLVRAIERMRGNEYYASIYPAKKGANELSRTVLAGLTAKKLFDYESALLEKKTHFQGQPFNLGYAGLGPLLVGYMQWLGREVKKDKVSKIFFLSREGWLLKQVYDAIHANDPDAIPSYYLYASRRATRVAGLKSIGDVISLAGHPYQSGVSVGNLLLDRFGLSADKVPPEIFEQANFADENDRLTTDPTGRSKFTFFCRLISDLILEHAKIECRDYMDYLHSTGFMSEGNPAVVDVGWRANMQGALSSLSQRNIAGYYYATLQGTERWLAKGLTCRAYMGELLSANHPSIIANNRALCEYLICHTEPSLICIVRNVNGFAPAFRNEINIGTRRVLLESIHRGAIEFAIDFNNHFNQYFDSIWIDAFLAEAALSSFILKPSNEDALMLKGHHFEDALGGVASKFIISQDRDNFENKSVWREGAIAIYSGVKVVKPSTQVNKPVDNKVSNIAPKENTYFEPESFVSQEKKTFRRSLENMIVKSFVSEKKYNKYSRDRNLFFSDVKSPIVRKIYGVK